MTPAINLVIQSYGNEREYLRAVMSVWSFYAHVSKDLRKTRTLLYCDDPDFFTSYLEGLPVTFISLSADRIKSMKGAIDFLHRIKIAVIEDAIGREPGNVFYVDSDTFFTDDPSRLLVKLGDSSVSLMHTPEYTFDSLDELPLPSGAPFRAVVDCLRSKSFYLSNGRSETFPSTLWSWNAGVIGLGKTHQALLSDVYAVTDQLFRYTRCHASEQYAFSIVLQLNTTIEACDSMVFHYWHRVKKQITDEFLKKRMSASWRHLSAEQKLRLIVKWTIVLTKLFRSHSLSLKDKSIQAFNRNDFGNGYLWAARALVRNPLKFDLIRDIAYHTRRYWSGG